MKFTLKKSDWLRAEDSALMIEDGRMCCIGQLAAQRGVDESDLLERFTAPDLDELPEGMQWLIGPGRRDSKDGEACYSINDDIDTTDDEKIAKLRPIFARHGIELEVVE